MTTAYSEEWAKERQSHLLLIDPSNLNTLQPQFKSIDVKPKLAVKLKPNKEDKKADHKDRPAEDDNYYYPGTKSSIFLLYKR